MALDGGGPPPHAPGGFGGSGLGAEGTAQLAGGMLPAVPPAHAGGPVPPRSSTRGAMISAGGVGFVPSQAGCDLNRTALNAAALQTVHRHGGTGRAEVSDLLSPRVYNGQILWQRRPAQLDGLPSTDISYHNDRLGHGLNLTSSDLRIQQQRWRAPAAEAETAPPQIHRRRALRGPLMRPTW